MNAHIRLIALAVGLALNTVALADDNSGPSQSVPKPASAQVAGAAEPKDAVGSSLQDMAEYRNSILGQFSVAGEQTLEQRLDRRRQFLAMADTYLRSLQAAQEDYRQFLMQAKTLAETCATHDEDVTDLPAQFAELIDAGKQECSEMIAKMDTRARVYAQRIDEASTFNDKLEDAAAHVRSQVARLETLQRASHLRDQVEAGLRAQDIETRGLQ